jgi:MGT family glycosyltransferase
MARILIATTPAMGHISPLVPLAKALVGRGHEVRWYTATKYRARVEASGAQFVGYSRARDFDDAKIDEEFPGRARLRGLAQLKYDMKHVFIDAGPDQAADIREIMRSFPADLLMYDTAMLGGLLVHEQDGPPSLAIGVLPMLMSSVDTAPFGLGLQPSTDVFLRVRNRVLNRVVQNVVFRDVQAHWQAMRARLQMGPTGWWLNHATRSTFYLQPSVRGFEYPRRDLAENVEFIGMIPQEQATGVAAPPFWNELDGSRPVIHVSQGTIANTTPDLIAPTLEGLAGEDVLVVVSTGNRPIEQLKLGNLPQNARIAPFLSYPELLPKTSVMVTNGGYGGVQMALSYGVPLVVAGASEDKPEVAARVAWSGAGLNLKTGRPKPHAVRAAVRAVLDEPRYRARAWALASEYRGYDPIARVIQIVETITSGASADARRRSGSEARSVERLVLDAGSLSKLV